MANDALGPREKAFVEAAAKGIPRVKAALVAGYGPSYGGAATQASRLMKNEKIINSMNAAIERRVDKARGLADTIAAAKREIGRAVAQHVNAETLASPELALGGLKTLLEIELKHREVLALGGESDTDREDALSIVDRYFARVLTIGLRARDQAQLERACAVARRLRR